MISLTDMAANKALYHITNREGTFGLRLGVKTTGCSGMAYVLEFVDAPEEGVDEVFEDKGVNVVISKKDLVYLAACNHTSDVARCTARRDPIMIRQHDCEGIQNKFAVLYHDKHVISDIVEGVAVLLVEARLVDRKCLANMHISERLADVRIPEAKSIVEQPRFWAQNSPNDKNRTRIA